MMDFAFGKSGGAPKNLKKLFVVEKELLNSNYEHKLVYYEELLGNFKHSNMTNQKYFILQRLSFFF